MRKENKRDDLYIKIDNQWSELPNWANFLINIGKTYYYNMPNKTKARMVLTLPSRSYAGVFIALGTVLAMISSKVDEKTIQNHFKSIKTLQIGTSVIFRKKDRIFRGIYNGTEIVNGVERIKITIQNTNSGNSRSLTEMLNPKQSLAVEVAEDKDYKLPMNPRGRENKFSRFLEVGFSSYDLNRLLTLSQSNWFYVGRKKWVKEEVIDTEIAVCDFVKKEYIQSNLNELLRIKEFTGEQDSYQGTLISSSGKFNAIPKKVGPKAYTIFDGSISYLRWSEHFKDSNWILILDRTEPQFQNALFKLEDEYVLSKRHKNGLHVDYHDIPKGIEMMYWEVY